MIRLLLIAAAIGMFAGVATPHDAAANAQSARTVCFLAKLVGKVSGCSVTEKSMMLQVGLPISPEKALTVCPQFRSRLNERGFKFDPGWTVRVIPSAQQAKAVSCSLL